MDAFRWRRLRPVNYVPEQPNSSYGREKHGFPEDGEIVALWNLLKNSTADGVEYKWGRGCRRDTYAEGEKAYMNVSTLD